MMPVYQLSAIDFSQFSLNAIRGQLLRWQQTWSALETPRVRLLFRSVPIDLSDPLRRVRQKESTAKDLLATHHLQEFGGILTQVARGSIVGLEHYLIIPDKDKREADSVADMLGQGLGIRVSPVPDLPSLLPTRYTVESGHLAPESGNHPFFSTVLSYDMAGMWEYSVMHNLMRRYPAAVSIEIITHHGSDAHAKLDRTGDMLQGLTIQVGAKAGLEKLHLGFEHLMRDVQGGLSLHQVMMAILVSGRTLEELANKEREVISSVTGRIYLRKIPGTQADAFRAFFTAQDKPSPQIRYSHNMTSAGVTMATTLLGVRSRLETDGVFWGISGNNPFFWDGFGPELKEPNHGVVLGTTGSGKTVSIFAIALRELNLMDSQIIVMEPMGNCRHLIDAVGVERSSYSQLSLRSLRINPVAVMYSQPAEQSAHLNVIIELLLGRSMDEGEQIALDSVTPLIYEGVTTDTPPANQPRIEQLAKALQGLGGEKWLQDASQRLGSVLHRKYVTGTRSTAFNVATQADWRLEKDLVAFNFQGIPDQEGLRKLMYYLVLSTIQREAHRQARKRRRIVIIDEFRALSSNPVLAKRVALMYKTFRTLGVGVWALEQDVITFTGLERGSSAGIDVASGTFMLNNSTFVIVLAQRSMEAMMLPNYFPHVTEDHVNYVMALNPQRTMTDKGRGLIILPDEVYPIAIPLTRFELAALARS